MLFLEALITYAVKFVFFIAVAVGGVFLGKKFRDNKDAKTTQAK